MRYYAIMKGDYFMGFSERLKAARKKAGLTQAAIAQKLHISPQSYAQYEHGSRKPKQDTLNKIADALQLGYNYAQNGEPYFFCFVDTVCTGEENEKFNEYQYKDAMGIDSTIANNIVKYRELYKISQKQLAEYIGVSTNILSKIEKGEISPSTDEIIKISRGLDLPIENLLDLPEKDDAEIQNEYLKNLFFKAGYFIFKVTADGSEKYWICNENEMYEIDIDTFNLFISSLNDYFLFNLQKMLNKFKPKVLKKQKGNSTDSDPNAENDSQNDE